MVPSDTKPQTSKDPKKQRWIKIALIVAFLVATIFIWYLTIPAALIWWFAKTKRISKKAKIISAITAGVLFLILCVSMSIAYYKDPTPSLQIQEPSDNATIKGHTVTIKGMYQPSDRKVWVNDKEITASNGQFEYTYDLNLGSNTITVVAGNWKRAKKELHITRELTDEEVAAQKKAEEERLAQEKAQQEADAKAKAEEEARQQAAEEQAKKDAEAKTKAEQEEQARIAAEKQAKKDAEAKAQAEAEANKWEEVFKFSGSGIKKSSVFTITSSETKIVLNNINSGYFGADIQAPQATFGTTLANTTDTGTQETYFYQKGDFVLDVNATGRWEITVYQNKLKK